MVCLVAVASARPQVYDYSSITDENDPRFMFDVSLMFWQFYLKHIFMLALLNFIIKLLDWIQRLSSSKYLLDFSIFFHEKSLWRVAKPSIPIQIPSLWWSPANLHCTWRRTRWSSSKWSIQLCWPPWSTYCCQVHCWWRWLSRNQRGSTRICIHQSQASKDRSCRPSSKTNSSSKKHWLWPCCQNHFPIDSLHQNNSRRLFRIPAKSHIPCSSCPTTSRTSRSSSYWSQEHKHPISLWSWWWKPNHSRLAKLQLRQNFVLNEIWIM